ncbi:unnamed protein product, partial [Choristocarpus tenellus]
MEPLPVDPLSYSKDVDEETLKEIKRLDALKNDMASGYRGYLERHPELTLMLDEFIKKVLLEKPDDVYAFAKSYFVDPNAGDHITRVAPVVIAGPSGVGKGTIIRRLMELFPNKFAFSCSHTTRSRREGEEDGVHYHFATRESMQEAIDKGEFIEHAEVHGNLYGTSVAAVEELSGNGKICVLDIDVQGVQAVKKANLEPYYVFVTPPSMEVLEQRLRDRGTEDKESVIRRLGKAKEEMDYGNSE